MKEKPSLFKKLQWLVPLFSLLLGFLAVWLAPKGIAWYFDPPAQFGFNCRAPIEWALERLQWSLAGGILSGAAVGFAISFFWWMRQKRKYEANSFLAP